MWAASRVLEVSQKIFGTYRKLGPEYFSSSNPHIRIDIYPLIIQIGLHIGRTLILPIVIKTQMDTSYPF